MLGFAVLRFEVDSANDKCEMKTRYTEDFLRSTGSSRLPPASCYHARSMETYRLMIVAGEASGDATRRRWSTPCAKRSRKPARILRRHRTIDARPPESNQLFVRRSLHPGLTGDWRALPKFWRAYKLLKQAAIERKPDAVILVDWPDFNLKLARALHRRGLKIIYYISPQLWAWRSYRARSIERDVDLLLSILPFEKDWYADRGIDHVEYVGHPLAGEVRARYDRAEFCRQMETRSALPIVSLLPGSRRKEVERILPPMLEAAALISARRPEVQFVVVVAPGRSSDELREHRARAAAVA